MFLQQAGGGSPLPPEGQHRRASPITDTEGLFKDLASASEADCESESHLRKREATRGKEEALGISEQRKFHQVIPRPEEI